MAILAAILLSLGVLRHYWDIYRERTVRGLSWGFVLLDAFGDLASLLAIGEYLQNVLWQCSGQMVNTDWLSGLGNFVVLRSPVDKLAVGIYASELVLWVGIMCAGLIYNLPKAFQRRFEDNSIATGNVSIDPPLETEAEVGVEIQEGVGEEPARMSVFRSIQPEVRSLPRFRLRNRTAVVR